MKMKAKSMPMGKMMKHSGPAPKECHEKPAPAEVKKMMGGGMGMKMGMKK